MLSSSSLMLKASWIWFPTIGIAWSTQTTLKKKLKAKLHDLLQVYAFSIPLIMKQICRVRE